MITKEKIKAAQCGDAAALNEVIEELYRPLLGLAQRLYSNPQEAEEACQEALLLVAKQLPSFEHRSQLKTWAWTVATRCYFQQMQKNGATQALRLEEFRADLEQGMSEATEAKQEDGLLLSQLKIYCGRALLQILPLDLRLSYTLGEIFEVSNSRASEILDVAEEVHRKRLSRARQKMTDALTGHCGVLNPNAKCRCHKRLAQAKKLGRVCETPSTPFHHLKDLENQLTQIQGAAERVGLYYRSEPQAYPEPELRGRLAMILRSSSD